MRINRSIAIIQFIVKITRKIQIFEYAITFILQSQLTLSNIHRQEKSKIFKMRSKFKVFATTILEETINCK